MNDLQQHLLRLRQQGRDRLDALIGKSGPVDPSCLSVRQWPTQEVEEPGESQQQEEAEGE